MAFMQECFTDQPDRRKSESSQLWQRLIRLHAGILCLVAWTWTVVGGEFPLYRKGPYLLYPGETNAMTIAFQTYQQPTKAVVEWGNTEKYEMGRTTIAQVNTGRHGHQFFHTLRKLPAGQQIYYRVVANGEARGGTFFVPPAKASDRLTFYAFGDTRAGLTAENRIAARLLTDMSLEPPNRQTFLLHTGDYVLCGLVEDYWDVEMFAPRALALQELLARLPLLGALGNHEGYDRRHLVEGGKTINLGQIGRLFRKYYPYPMYVDPKRFYYSFDYGPVHVAVVDTWTYPGRYRHEQPNTAQETWLTRDLETTSCPWKVVLLHTPVYDWNRRDEGLQTMLAPLFERTGVQLVIQGHEHYYARMEVRGVQYLVLGGGGANLTKFKPVSASAPEAFRYRASVHHFGRFDIQGEAMRVHILTSEGKLVEPPFTIPQR